MKAHVFQHVPFEGLGSIEEWLLSNDYEISFTKFFDSYHLPNLEEIDLLIIMGGPMSVNEIDKYPWLIEEKRLIKNAIEKQIPTLGICLGAQLIASSLGASIYPNAEKEIGWFPIYRAENCPQYAFQFPKEVNVFHWHGETYDLPQNANLLASSEACVNQAFQIDTNVIGLQFHLETTPYSLNEIIENCSDELIDGKFIQSVEEILSASENHFIDINNLMGDILSYLTAA